MFDEEIFILGSAARRRLSLTASFRSFLIIKNRHTSLICLLPSSARRMHFIYFMDVGKESKFSACFNSAFQALILWSAFLDYWLYLKIRFKHTICFDASCAARPLLYSLNLFSLYTISSFPDLNGCLLQVLPHATWYVETYLPLLLLSLLLQA